jgi:hypothetical protein
MSRLREGPPNAQGPRILPQAGGGIVEEQSVHAQTKLFFLGERSTPPMGLGGGGGGGGGLPVRPLILNRDSQSPLHFPPLYYLARDCACHRCRCGEQSGPLKYHARPGNAVVAYSGKCQSGPSVSLVLRSRMSCGPHFRIPPLSMRRRALASTDGKSTPYLPLVVQ